MGRSRYHFTHPDQPHFLTLTVLHWIPIFTRPATVQILFDSFQHLINQGLNLYAYVILENPSPPGRPKPAIKPRHSPLQILHRPSINYIPPRKQRQNNSWPTRLLQKSPQIRPRLTIMARGLSSGINSKWGYDAAENWLYSPQSGETRLCGCGGALAIFQCAQLYRAERFIRGE